MVDVRKPCRHIAVVSIDWLRPKDPTVSLAHGSLLAAIRQDKSLCVHSFCFAANSVRFNAFDAAREILKSVSAHTKSTTETEICFGAYVWNDALIRSIIRNIRDLGFAGRIVLGGPQITYCGPTLESLYPDVDIFIRGYAEDALRQLEIAGSPDKIPGVHVAGRSDGMIQGQSDLDSLPSPYLTSEIEVEQPHGFIRWETQRGCPYDCSFCQHREAAPLRKRRFAWQRIEEEVAFFARQNVADIAVVDPIFNLGSHALYVLEEFDRRRYSPRLSLQCRFELVNQEFLKLCSRVGCRLEFGLQTVDAREGDAVNRVNDLSRVSDVLSELRGQGIAFEVSIIYGLPEQTLESFRETVGFLMRNRVPTIRAFPLMLLRGTALERDRQRWHLRESQNLIPVVIESSSFSVQDWVVMNAIANALEQTVGQHPAAVDDLCLSADIPNSAETFMRA